MNGYKTFITGAISIISGVAMALGIEIDHEVMTGLQGHLETVIGGLMAAYGLIMIILRAFTNSPMFNKESK